MQKINRITIFRVLLLIGGLLIFSVAILILRDAIFDYFSEINMVRTSIFGWVILVGEVGYIITIGILTIIAAVSKKISYQIFYN